VNEHWFEIVRRTYGRYSWVFVEVDGQRRRILARSDRDYGSKKKVKRAIAGLKKDFSDAVIRDATRSPACEPFPLPVAHFHVVSGVVPLIVDEAPVDVTVGRPVLSRRRGMAGNHHNAIRSDERAATERAPAAAEPVPAASEPVPAGANSRPQR
jgi:uncharacterized protein YegP (UPF0339 family)